MLKKIDQAQLFLEEQVALFRCPICQSAFKVTDSGVACHNAHRFDLSKKGTLFFLNHALKSEYDQTLFQARGRMIHAGMYERLLERLRPYLTNQKVLDIGCGEGSFLSLLAQAANPTVTIGFDIAKEGVYQATNQTAGDFWCTADLTNLPFADASFDCLLNIFSPSNYQEFKRILAPSGKLIKIVPGARYLQELRQAFYPDDEQKQRYSNEKVVEKFTQEFTNVTREQITYEFAIPDARQVDILEMSPLEWGVTSERKAFLQNNPIKFVTIDLEILVGTA